MDDPSETDRVDRGRPSSTRGAILGASIAGFISWILLRIQTHYYPETDEVPLIGVILVSGGLILGALIGALFRIFQLSPKMGLISGIILGFIMGSLFAMAGLNLQSWADYLIIFSVPVTICGITGLFVCIRFE